MYMVESYVRTLRRKLGLYFMVLPFIAALFYFWPLGSATDSTTANPLLRPTRFYREPQPRPNPESGSDPLRQPPRPFTEPAPEAPLTGPPETNIHPEDTKDDPDFPWRTRTQRHPVAPSEMHTLPTDSSAKKQYRVQAEFGAETERAYTVRVQRRSAVKAAFLHCWQAYRRYAWGHDELRPLSGASRKAPGLAGWGATLVDSLDTLWIMDLRKEFYEAVDQVTRIDFATAPDEEINVFEVNIRLLGGLLGAYDLSADERLLKKAKEVGEMLYAAFDTPNRMPVTRWNPYLARKGDEQLPSEKAALAEVGSFALEFTRLSLLTGDVKWFDAVQRITEKFVEQMEDSHLPGMFPTVVNALEGRFSSEEGARESAFSYGAPADSFYEYLPKMHALLGGQAKEYQVLYEEAIKYTRSFLAFRPMTPAEDDVLFTGAARTHLREAVNPNDPDEIVVDVETTSSHLACYLGGMIALGARLFALTDDLALAERYTRGCTWAYGATPTGLAPEVFSTAWCDPVECAWNETHWKHQVLELAGHEVEQMDEAWTARAEAIIAQEKLPAGLTAVDDARYLLRPEAIESVFVLHRTTADPAYMDEAWRMFEAVQAATRTQLANAAVADVRNISYRLAPAEESTTSTARAGAEGIEWAAKGKGRWEVPLLDEMESFWMGETLKYFYLTFSDPELVSLDEWVLNTEAHPFRRM